MEKKKQHIRSSKQLSTDRRFCDLPARRLAHGLLMLLFMVAYLAVFSVLDQRLAGITYNQIHCWLDKYIPFCEVFVVFYLLWFAYVAVTAVVLFFKDYDAFDRNAVFLVVGMSLFLIIGALHPNTIDVRPETFPRDNVFTALVGMIYATDPPVCVFPSIHVFNSLSTHCAIRNSKYFADKPAIRLASGILCVLIVLSTMLIKQHSVIDVVGGIALALVCYVVIYSLDALGAYKRQREGAPLSE